MQLIDYAISENFIFLLATTISPEKTMDATATNLGSNGNEGNEGYGGDKRRPSEEETRGSGRKDKGKRRMTAVWQAAAEEA
jgi:hypothetical protein